MDKRLISLILFILFIPSFYMIYKNIVYVILLMGYILFHEIGHFLACMLYRVKTYGLYFIPFLGGCVLFDFPYERKKCFIIIMAGAASGLLYTIGLCAILWIGNGFPPGISKFNMLILVLAGINLVNLLPFYPFDGGRMLAAIGLSITKHFGWISRIISFFTISGLFYLLRDSVFDIFVLVSIYMLTGFGRLPYDELNGQDMSNKWIMGASLGYGVLFLCNIMLCVLIFKYRKYSY